MAGWAGYLGPILDGARITVQLAVFGCMSALVAAFTAGLQLEALTLVRSIERARIWARQATKAARIADKASEKLGIEVESVSSAEAVVRSSDIIVTTTPSTAPLVKADWLSPGQHITAMGSDAEHKNELSPAIIKAADLYVYDRLKQYTRLGELHHALDADLIDPGTAFPELGEIIAGKVAGRSIELNES